MRIYTDRMLPNNWIVGDIDGEMHIVPAISNGWEKRTQYAIPPGVFRAKRLEEVPSFYAIGVGIPSLETRTVEAVRG